MGFIFSNAGQLYTLISFDACTNDKRLNTHTTVHVKLINVLECHLNLWLLLNKTNLSLYTSRCRWRKETNWSVFFFLYVVIYCWSSVVFFFVAWVNLAWDTEFTERSPLDDVLEKEVDESEDEAFRTLYHCFLTYVPDQQHSTSINGSSQVWIFSLNQTAVKMLWPFSFSALHYGLFDRVLPKTWTRISLLRWSLNRFLTWDKWLL